MLKLNFKLKSDPARERERTIQFLSAAAGVALIFLLRPLAGTNWAILSGIVLYFGVGIWLERRWPPPPQKPSAPPDPGAD